jgi:hypothetical protein
MLTMEGLIKVFLFVVISVVSQTVSAQDFQFFVDRGLDFGTMAQGSDGQSVMPANEDPRSAKFLIIFRANACIELAYTENQVDMITSSGTDEDQVLNVVDFEVTEDMVLDSFGMGLAYLGGTINSVRNAQEWGTYLGKNKVKAREVDCNFRTSKSDWYELEFNIHGFVVSGK